MPGSPSIPYRTMQREREGRQITKSSCRSKNGWEMGAGPQRSVVAEDWTGVVSLAAGRCKATAANALGRGTRLGYWVHVMAIGIKWTIHHVVC